MTADIPKLRELLAKATPGPWNSTTDHKGYMIDDGKGYCVAGAGTLNQHGADMDAIVAAVNALPALLSELEALREAIIRPDLSAAMCKMDEVGFGKWESACEIARYSIMAQVVYAALDKARKEVGK